MPSDFIEHYMMYLKYSVPLYKYCFNKQGFLWYITMSERLGFSADTLKLVHWVLTNCAPHVNMLR